MPLSREELLPAVESGLNLLADQLPQLPPLDGRQRDQLAAYLSLVSAYAGAAQLTAFSTAAELAGELATESLRLLAPGLPPRGTSLLDLGSGSGSPVVPLAIACPDADCTACESNGRKAAFLRQCAASLRLGNLHMAEGRAEEQPAGRWDIVTSRAFMPLPRLLPLAARLLAGHGELRGFLGAETAELAGGAGAHGFSVAEVIAYEVGGKERHVYRLTL
jgi:16S rRNA (guanine527-N7)-methyltransferase